MSIMTLAKMSPCSSVILSLAMLILLAPHMSIIVNAFTFNDQCPWLDSEEWGGPSADIKLWKVELYPDTLKEIKGNFGAVIDSLTFTMVSADTGGIDTYRFGGDGGSNNEVSIKFNDPDENIIGIKGVHADHVGHNERDIATLYFQTDKRGWLGPIGIENYTDLYRENVTAFSFSLQDSIITGFRGRYNNYINSIAVFFSTNC